MTVNGDRTVRYRTGSVCLVGRNYYASKDSLRCMLKNNGIIFTVTCAVKYPLTIAKTEFLDFFLNSYRLVMPIFTRVWHPFFFVVSDPGKKAV